MLRCLLSFVLFVSVFEATLALRIRPPTYNYKCVEVGRHCDKAVCGMTTCTVKEKCCSIYYTYKCYYKQREVKSCAPFYCENGGTRIPLKGKRDVTTHTPVSGCEIPPPICRCPPGFSGRCCEIRDPIDPCKYKKCGYGEECKLQTVQCVTTPCPPIAVCVPVDLCKYKTCPKGEVCQLVPILCVTTPCPSKFEAVCVPIDPCLVRLCPRGTTCKNLGNGKSECVRPGICPPNDIIGICQVTKDSCLSDTQCNNNEKCCSRGCGRQCVSVLTNPCAAILCLQGHTCVVQDNGQGKCVPQIIG
ncbi:fibropellin-1-like [Corticium candelabrum]|uniref:fibropellin-1-like n=1 Tax=Corticium candelabrum TaxID=121492 RepID=UPI002E270E44|nr:fibropellin-1-like [Corticium candelabrum]